MTSICSRARVRMSTTRTCYRLTFTGFYTITTLTAYVYLSAATAYAAHTGKRHVPVTMQR